LWSVSVYDAKGYNEKNALNAYSLNSITAKNGADGTVGRKPRGSCCSRQSRLQHDIHAKDANNFLIVSRASFYARARCVIS
jgi:hypothetical protein